MISREVSLECPYHLTLEMTQDLRNPERFFFGRITSQRAVILIIILTSSLSPDFKVGTSYLRRFETRPNDTGLYSQLLRRLKQEACKFKPAWIVE